MFRRDLKILPSHLYAGGVVIVDPLYAEPGFAGPIVNTFNSRAAAIRWCRRNGWRWME